MTTIRYEIVTGNRNQPGAVLATFSGDYACGGPATACLRAYDRMIRRGEITMNNAFFRKVS